MVSTNGNESGETEFVIFSNLQGNRCSIFNDLRKGFAYLQNEKTKENYRDFEILVKEVTKLFASISNEVKEM